MSICIKIHKYINTAAVFKDWNSSYIQVANLVGDLISTPKLSVIHIGSTSFMVGGKGIIDLSVLYEDGDLESAVSHLLGLGFQNQQGENVFPETRPRKDGMIIIDDKEYLLHVHVIQRDSEEHITQLKYKEYMLANKSARLEYENCKKEVLSQGITEQHLYGKSKSPFVKSVIKEIKYQN